MFRKAPKFPSISKLYNVHKRVSVKGSVVTAFRWVPRLDHVYDKSSLAKLLVPTPFLSLEVTMTVE